MKFETQLLILDVFEALRVVLIACVEIVMKIVMKNFFHGQFVFMHRQFVWQWSLENNPWLFKKTVMVSNYESLFWTYILTYLKLY